MSIVIGKTYSKDKTKIWYKIELGRENGQRFATGIFTYVTPNGQIQKNHNKQALDILEMKKAQLVLDTQAIASGYIPEHKFKANFFDFYADFIKKNRRAANRHLECSLSSLKTFAGKPVLSPVEITDSFVVGFRKYLLDKYNGETPASYFARFKRVLRSATKAGYFKVSPADDIAAKSNRNFQIKDILTQEEYFQLVKCPCSNYEVKKAFVFSLYTGLRWSDIHHLNWEAIKDETKTFKLIQNKTGNLLERPLHSIARQIIGERRTGRIFQLPTQDGANKVLRTWATNAGINKHITWHCARHSFSVLLQENGIDNATVAGMLGHTSTKFVERTYQRYREVNGQKAIATLPSIVLNGL